MLATRQDSKATIGSRRDIILRWLMAGLVLLALGFVSLSTAQAHPTQNDSAQAVVTMVTMQDATAPDSVQCCHDSQHEHGSETCSALGHCGGCAVDDGRVAAPVPSLDAHPGQRLTTLRTGLVTGPVGHPPKAI